MIVSYGVLFLLKYKSNLSIIKCPAPISYIAIVNSYLLSKMFKYCMYLL